MKYFPPERNKGFDIGISIPLLIDFRWENKNRNQFFLQAGVNFRYSLMHYFEEYQHYLEDTLGRTIHIFTMLSPGIGAVLMLLCTVIVAFHARLLKLK